MKTFWRNLLPPSTKSRTCRYTNIPWTWRLNITVKWWSISTELQDIASHKTVIFIVQTVRTSKYNIRWYLVKTEYVLTCVSKPRISWEIDDVLPDCTSWRCRNMFSRARPRPLSSWPCVNTPSSVDLPASALPITATRTSMLCWSSGTYIKNVELPYWNTVSEHKELEETKV